MNFVRMFKPRFAALVESGTKTQTVRPIPKRMPRPGDMISLRCWTGLPYRSKQRVLREAELCEVLPIQIYAPYGPLRIVIRGVELDPELCDIFAAADGFADLSEMHAWFRDTHGLPFSGIVLYWHNKDSTSTQGTNMR